MKPNQNKYDFLKQAKKNKRRIVLPEGEAIRIQEAAAFCDEHDIAEIVLLGSKERIQAQFDEQQLPLGNIQIIDPVNHHYLGEFSQELLKLYNKRKLTIEDAIALCKEPLNFANLMVKKGDVDACVAGAQNSTSNVIRAALKIIGTKTAETRLSSFFIMLTESLRTPVFFADCAINISPDAGQLAYIAVQSAQNTKVLLGLEPKVAMLSFSSNGSAKHEEVSKVRNAVEIINRKYPDLNVIGEIQFDAAISQEILNKKWPESDFSAPANIFIFPSLEAANIGYKIAEQMGQTTAIGPILQGLAKPVNDLSRGADVKSIVNTIAVTCLQVGG